MSSWPARMLTAPLQFAPRCARAQIANATPSAVSRTPASSTYRAFRDKAPSERAETHERFKEKDVGSRHRQDLPHSLGTRFLFLSRFLVARGEKPIHPQNNPAANGQRKRYPRHIVLPLYLRRERTYCFIPPGAKLVLAGPKCASKMVS